MYTLINLTLCHGFKKPFIIVSLWKDFTKQKLNENQLHSRCSVLVFFSHAVVSMVKPPEIRYIEICTLLPAWNFG